MKTPLIVASGSGLVAVAFLNDISVALFGVPIAVWTAAASGALFGMAFMPASSAMSRPWTAVASAGAGVFLGRVLGHLLGVSEALIPGLAFLLAAAPAAFVRFVIKRLGAGND